MRKLLLPTILFIIAISSFFWYTKPTYEEISTINDEISQYETALNQVSEIQKTRGELMAEYEQIPQDNLYVLSRILPTSFDRVRFLIEMDRIATANGLTAQDVSFSNSSGEGTSGIYQSTEVSFSTSGSYEEVQSFIRDVEQSARLIDITELSISGTSGGSGGSGGSGDTFISSGPTGGQNTYEFTGKTYWLTDES